jgi:hypothetical protein
MLDVGTDYEVFEFISNYPVTALSIFCGFGAGVWN